MDGLFLKTFETDSGSGVVILKIGGSLDFNKAALFEAKLQELLQNKKFKIVINMGKLSYMASTGIGVLMAFIETIRKN